MAETLMVKCKLCEATFPSPLQMERQAFTDVKGAFIWFLPITRAFAKTTVRRWALNWLKLGAKELRALSGAGAEGGRPG